MYYLWLKALHVAAALIFVGGVLATAIHLKSVRDKGILLRNAPHAAQSLSTWNRFVTTTAMLAVWGLGLTLQSLGGWSSFWWMKTKIVLVVLLSALHGVQSGTLRRLAGGSAATSRTAGFAGPLVVSLAILIALLVVLKPF